MSVVVVVVVLLTIIEVIDIITHYLIYLIVIQDLWCGSSWNDVLENCAKNCPEGSDEECGPGLICYDLTGNDLICETAGVGVKEKGDPQTVSGGCLVGLERCRAHTPTHYGM